MTKTLPTFMGIGAQKAGTGWLTKHLRKHHEIWMSPVKELHFFDRSPRYPSPNKLATSSPFARIFGSESWERPQVTAGLKVIVKHLKAGNFGAAKWSSKMAFGYYNEKWYRGLFSEAVSYKACGEITPAYSILEMEDVRRIKTVNPDIKLIYLIRNPIDRAWSAIRYDVNRGLKINLDSEDEIIANLKNRGWFCVEIMNAHWICIWDALIHDRF